MKISQILNNNVALVKRGGNEVFVVAKGIGFKKKKGQQSFRLHRLSLPPLNRMLPARAAQPA